MPWTGLHCSEWNWRCPGPLSAVQTGAPVCSKVCPYDSFWYWDDQTIAPLFGWVDAYCCVFRSWWAYFTNIALYCIHWMMTMILWKCLNSESYVAIAFAPSACRIWWRFFTEVAFLSCRSVFVYRQLGPAGVFVWARSAVPFRDGTAANNLVWPTWFWRQS